jgi:hypothetical protein
MFITDAKAKIPFPSALFGEEPSDYWDYVKLHIHTPWFFCVYAVPYEDGKEYMHMIFLSRDQQLQEISQMEIKILEVQVALPIHMTRQDRWVMAPLTLIWEGEIPGEDGTELVYVTLDGRRFSSNGKVSDESQLVNKRIFYKPPIEHAS